MSHIYLEKWLAESDGAYSHQETGPYRYLQQGYDFISALYGAELYILGCKKQYLKKKNKQFLVQHLQKCKLH